jgi:hypothetical protein
MISEAMEPRGGKVINGAIVLEEADDLEEGASVTVWVGDPSEPVEVSAEELDLIREGQAVAARGELLDARAFLEELRNEA